MKIQFTVTVEKFSQASEIEKFCDEHKFLYKTSVLDEPMFSIPSLPLPKVKVVPPDPEKIKKVIAEKGSGNTRLGLVGENLAVSAIIDYIHANPFNAQESMITALRKQTKMPGNDFRDILIKYNGDLWSWERSAGGSKKYQLL
jgi:hypothetical protein